MRIKAVVAYDGSAFRGFQRQSYTEETVTGAIEKALGTIGVDVRIVGSGRTDAGVHASGQIVHFDLPKHWGADRIVQLREHLNKKLKKIYFKHICIANDNFHARFDAKVRIYRYVYKSRAMPSVFESNYISALRVGDEKLLRKALDEFVGTHDFKYFRKTGSDTKDTVRTIYKAFNIERGGYGYIYFHADGYLRSQVRLMVEAASALSTGRIGIEELRSQLQKKERFITKPADPSGLYLARVLY